MMKYLYLSSKNSLNIYPTNTSYDFTVELPNTIFGVYECALADITYSDTVQQDMYVYSDICEENVIDDKYLPILRVVSAPGEISNYYFVNASREAIQRVRVFIRDANFKVPSVSLGTVRVTLLLRRV